MQKLEPSLLLGSFLSYVGITLFKGDLSIANAIVALSIASLYAYSQYRSGVNQLDAFNKSVADLRKELDTYKTSHEDLKNTIAGVKIAQGFRQVK